MSAPKKTKHMDQFTALGELTTLVCDTGDVEAIKRLKPTDATTNPSLIYKAASQPQYLPLVKDAVAYGKALPASTSDAERLAATMDRLAVNFGAEITKIVPGYAAEVLEKEGVKTNLTLLFSLAQAVAAAEAGATLISPFVGRILDWWKKETGKGYADPEEDPGVQSVRQIYGYYKKYGYKTIVMGASFRNTGEITALAGCDRLTISPGLLDELKACCDPLPRVLEPSKAAAVYGGAKLRVDEKAFRLMMNADAMATDKLAEGIRGFAADIEKLEAMIAKKL
eukprot:evm.model.NODE_18421_length_4857_cov_28.924438.2